MPSADIDTSKKISKTIFWHNHLRNLPIYFSGCTALAFYHLVLNPDLYASSKYIDISVLVFSAVLYTVCILLMIAYKRGIALMANNADVRNSVADYLVKKISKHRHFFNYFYIETLIKLGDSRAAHCLALILKSIFPGRRQYAVIWLGKLGGEKAIEVLKAAIDDKNYDVSEEAKKQYSKLTEETH